MSTGSALDTSWPLARRDNLDAVSDSCDTTWDAVVSMAVVIVAAIPA
jgi:hypothetical protein